MELQEKGGQVSLREYLDMQILYLGKELAHIRERIAHEKELNTRTSELKAEALDLQAEKYEQRLAALNHEAERLQLMVTREFFDEVTGQQRKEIDDLKLWKSNTEGKQARSQLISIAALVFSIVMGIITFLKK